MKEGDTFIDVGCGYGFFTLPASRIVGTDGKVYGLDVDAEAISIVEKKAHQERLTNLRLEVGKAEDTIFCEACADIVFFGIVLHDFADAATVLDNARLMMKQHGRLVDLDWNKEPMDFGPPLSIRFSEEYAAKLIRASGFAVERTEKMGPYNYLILAETHKQ